MAGHEIGQAPTPGGKLYDILSRDDVSQFETYIDEQEIDLAVAEEQLTETGQPRGSTLAGFAASMNAVEVCKYLEENEPEILGVPLAENGRTPLHSAAMFGATDVVRYLLTLDYVDVTEKDGLGNDPLAYALLKGKDEEVVRCLLEKWSDHEVPYDGEYSMNGQTCNIMHLALYGMEVAAVELLFEHSVTKDNIERWLRSTTSTGLTPLAQVHFSTQKLELEVSVDVLRHLRGGIAAIPPQKQALLAWSFPRYIALIDALQGNAKLLAKFPEADQNIIRDGYTSHVKLASVNAAINAISQQRSAIFQRIDALEVKLEKLAAQVVVGRHNQGGPAPSDDANNNGANP